MDINKAKEILGINKDNFDENDLKTAWREFSKLYHPDSQNLSDIARFQEGNEAHSILKDYLTKINFNADYVNRKILSLNTFYIANFSNVNIPKLEIVKSIEDEINALKNKYVDQYNNLKINNAEQFEQEYKELSAKINQKVSTYLNNLFKEMDNSYVNDPEIKRLYDITKEEIKSQNNIYSIYDLYDKYMKKVEDYINKTPLTLEYVKDKSDNLAKKYIGEKAFYNNEAYKRILTWINRLCLELGFKYKDYNNITQFEKFYQQIDQKIEKAIIEYRNDLLDELKNEKLSAKFPQIDVIINGAKMNISGQTNISTIYQIYNETKQEIEKSIKNKIKEELNYQTEVFKKDPNYDFVKNVVERSIQHQIETYYKQALNGTLENNYQAKYQQTLYRIFQDYQLLVNKKQELLGELEPFVGQPYAINIINELNNAKEYEELERANVKAYEIVEKLNKNNKEKQIANIQSELLDKLSAKAKNSTPHEIRQSLAILDSALGLLESYSKDQLDVNINILKQINFNSKLEDLKLIKDASVQVSHHNENEEDDILMIDLVRGAGARR